MGSDSARRVPSERRRTPGERSTSERMNPAGVPPRTVVPGTGQRISDPNARRRGSLETAPARLRAERDRRRSRTKTIVAAIAIAVVVIVLAGIGSAYAYVKHVERTMQVKTFFKKEDLAVQLTKAAPQDPYNVLILGTDARPDETQYRSDTMILAHINPQTKQVWLMSIPRDTKAEIPGYGTEKINAAHFLGGPPLAVETVSDFTGLKINHYVEVNFWAFEKAVNALGGVWVNVPVAINDKQADRSPGHKAAKIPKGYQRLDGYHALTFVRARHQFADQDFSRMKNQQLFIKALADQMMKTQNITKIPSIVNAIAPFIVTDMNVMDMMRTAMALHDAGSKNIHAATVTGPWKAPYIVADEAVLSHLVSDIRHEIPFEGTKTVEASATAGTAKTTKKPSQISVTVRNGSGLVGAAKQTSSVLKTQKFNIVGKITNANQNVYSQTYVIYKTDPGPAQLVASYLVPTAKLVKSRGMYSFTTDVLVIVGKDWDVTKVPAAPINTQ
jgi:polyisoprenyl-teichoic acid--peptidoglycan teichoic acid transferase